MTEFKTLGDYSQLCQRLSETLIQIADGDLWVVDYRLNLSLMILEDDGMIEPLRVSDKPYLPELTPKGREMANRGGYANFNPFWVPNLFDIY